MISVPLAADENRSPDTSATWCAYTTKKPASTTQPSSTRPSLGTRPRRALMIRVTVMNAMTIRTAASAWMSMCCVRYLMETMFRPHVAMTNIN
ncbi:hypothetical protein D3C81_1841930 [compost metagenome]